MAKSDYVYLLASGRNGTLCLGVTNDLIRRVGEHEAHLVPGFTSKYDVTKLIWYETHTSVDAAIVREKQIKKEARMEAGLVPRQQSELARSLSFARRRRVVAHQAEAS
jgi:putative endonuclease